jgi:hypothetical protein
LETISPADLPILGHFSERALGAEQIDVLLLRHMSFQRLKTWLRTDSVYFGFRDD